MNIFRRKAAPSVVPSSSATVLAQADAARDAGRWDEGYLLFRRFVEIHPDRNGLLVQSGHCLKELGRYRSALHEYLSVSSIEDKGEADYQVGELLKLTGNGIAAGWAYRRSASLSHPLAIRELDALARGDASCYAELLSRLSKQDQQDQVSHRKFFSLEITPYDWRRLASAAEEAAILGLVSESQLLGDLALIVGGPAIERQHQYRTVFSGTGLWGARYAHILSPSADRRPSSSEALTDWLRAADLYLSPPSTPARQRDVGQDQIRFVDADNIFQELLDQFSSAYEEVRTALFTHDSVSLVDAINGLGKMVFPDNEGIFCSIADLDVPRVGCTARRVCLNIATAVARRLSSAVLTVPPEHLLASFLIPTARANLATRASSDHVAAGTVLALEPLHDAAAEQKLSELTAIGIFPDSGSNPTDLLRSLADEGRQLPIEYWYEVSGPTAPPSIVGDVCIRLANVLKRRGLHHHALIWTERAACAVPDQYTIDLGIQRKTVGDFAGAASAFIWVLERHPDFDEAAKHLDAVVRECMSEADISTLAEANALFRVIYNETQSRLQTEQNQAHQIASNRIVSTVLDVAALPDSFDFGPERLEWKQIGWLRSGLGAQSVPRLVGVIAVRVHLVTRDPPLRMRVRLNGSTIDTVEPSPSGVDGKGFGRYYFNSWIDTARIARGIHVLQAYVEQRSSGYCCIEHVVRVDDLGSEERYDSSDAFVQLPPDDVRTVPLTEAILSLPAVIRPSARVALSGSVHHVLVMRLDQLGDLCASMPAIRRLKEIFPGAHFEAIVTPPNAYVLHSAGLFDEIITIDFPYDHGTRRRWLSRSSYGKLRDRYANATVDLAIDLSPSEDSRPILQLIPSRYRAGFNPHRYDFLDFGVEIVTRDPVNRREAVSHTALIGSFVEALASVLRPAPHRFPVNTALARHLGSFELRAGEYIAVHVGARLAIKRWPLRHYIALTAILSEETARDIVMFTDDPLPDAQSEELAAIPGVQVFSGKMELEVFDSLLSHAAVFVGNDTGPKHFASMRGVKTVSVHMGQVNWNEWGQDGVGLIVSKNVPCCGCGIEDPSECGKAMACLDGLSPREVADAVLRLIGEGLN